MNALFWLLAVINAEDNLGRSSSEDAENDGGGFPWYAGVGTC